MPEAKYFQEPGGDVILQPDMPSIKPYFVLQLPRDYSNGSCPVRINYLKRGTRFVNFTVVVHYLFHCQTVHRPYLTGT